MLWQQKKNGEMEEEAETVVSDGADTDLSARTFEAVNCNDDGNDDDDDDDDTDDVQDDDDDDDAPRKGTSVLKKLEVKVEELAPGSA
ncbi:GL16422 [Drosophila persimilis]|uniref:GL16422 n=1 Tax=Drosophila persimilis TaxID=7234 RepID=B4GWJ8_DROPE|nr:GL16422 [Drosophila persimilis]